MILSLVSIDYFNEIVFFHGILKNVTIYRISAKKEVKIANKVANLSYAAASNSNGLAFEFDGKKI